MNVMVTGSGAREHALAWAARHANGNPVENLYIAPGNAGTAEIGENVDIPVTDIEGQVRFAWQNNVDFTIIGPDDQLAAGVVDAFQENGLAVFGPNQAAAQIESSKSFAKAIMAEEGIPTAAHKVFDHPTRALEYLADVAFPLFVKADGLALGKGAVEVRDFGEAEQAIVDMMMDKKFGESGARVVIEEHLGGPEAPEISLHALTDGNAYLMLPAAQDHKTIGENHQGPMTGGMGVVAPLPGISKELTASYGEQVIRPLLEGMRARDVPFRGLLYPSIKLQNGQPQVVEYNARFGDPEASVYSRLQTGDLLEALMATQEGRLDTVDLRWHDAAVVCVAIASAGYPGPVQKGVSIEGIDAANSVPGVQIFHAGTARKNGQLVTNGGRVLNVTALGKTLGEAQARAYEAVGQIHIPGSVHRRDIGAQAIAGINLGT